MDPTGPNLLALALAQTKNQWSSGEIVWLWKDQAYLCNDSGFINLWIVGYSKPLTIY
jgi:hypothetical protein